jgi:hypothetical protein
VSESPLRRAIFENRMFSLTRTLRFRRDATLECLCRGDPEMKKQKPLRHASAAVLDLH